MSNDANQLTAESVRMRLEILRNYRYSVVRAGEECLRAAMEEYMRCFAPRQEQDPA